MSPEELRRLADGYRGPNLESIAGALRQAADEIDSLRNLVERLREEVAEKKDIDELVAASVASQETRAFVAENARLRAESAALRSALQKMADFGHLERKPN